MNRPTKNKAYSIFSDWVSNAKNNFPTLNYEIRDPAVLESDLEEVVNKAIKALTKEEKTEDRKKSGYDYGYVCGFIKGNLNTLWYNEYIKKQSTIYKMLAAITVLESYLKFDDLLKIRLSNLFTEYYKREVNLDNLPTAIEIELPFQLSFLDTDNSYNPILATLENIKIQMIKNVFDEDVPDFLPGIKKYFSTEEIDRILNQTGF